MAFKNYDPKRVSLYIGGVRIGGYEDGSFITVEYNADAFTPYVGADGEYGRSKNADESGKITVRLTQTSKSNDILSALAIADRASGTGTFIVSVRDLNGTTVATSESAYILKRANAEFAKEIGPREWPIYCAPLKMFVGGTTAA